MSPEWGRVSQAEIDADIAVHAALATGIHGVGAGTVAKTADITATKLDAFAAPDDNTDLNVSTTKHGLTPKLPNDDTKFLDGKGNYTTPGGAGGDMTKAVYDPNADGVIELAQLAPLVCSESEADTKVGNHAALATGVHGVGAGTVAKTADITATKLDDLSAPDDNTDLNVSTTKHGLTPKLPDDNTKFLNGVGGYTVPPGASQKLQTVSVTVKHDSASPLAIVTIPENSVVLALSVKVTEIWDGTNPYFRIGDAGTPTGLVSCAAADLAATGYIKTTSTTWGAFLYGATPKYGPYVVIASDAIIATITVSGATQGEAVVTIWYMVA